MIDILYKILNFSETVENSISKIKEAFIEFYGESEKKYIDDKFENLAIINHGLLEATPNIVTHIKELRSAEYINKFLDNIGFQEEKEKLRTLLFSTISLDHPVFLPIQHYCNYIECKSDLDEKKRALTFLQSINPNVTLENMDELHESGVFDRFINIIPLYKEMISSFSEESKKLDNYLLKCLEIKRLQSRVEKDCWKKLVNEFFFLAPEEVLKAAMSDIDYSSIAKHKQFISYFGSNLTSKTLIESFSKENEELLETGDDWRRQSIIKDRIAFFNNMGINLGDNYELYKNNSECKKLVPSQFVIEQLTNKKKLYKNEIYKATEEYKKNKEKIDNCNLYDNHDDIALSFYNTSRTAMIPRIKKEDNKNILFPIIGININIYEGLDVVIIHELNHVYELNLIDVDDKYVEYCTGWDGIIDRDNFGYKEDKRTYEIFNEIINHIIAIKITKKMHNKGNYIFSDKNHDKLVGITSYENVMFLVTEFYKTYEKEILQSRKAANIEVLLEKVGEENFNDLNNLIEKFYNDFSAKQLEDIIINSKLGKETEDTIKYKQVCKYRDEILNKMKEHSMRLVK